MEHGMRLKQDQKAWLIHSKRSILGHGLDRDLDTGTKPANSQLIHSMHWTKDLNAKEAEPNGNISLTNLHQSHFQCQRPSSPANRPADEEVEVRQSSSSSSDTSPEAEDYRSLSLSSDTDSDDRPSATAPRAVVNPNYPGFQHFAEQLLTPSPSDSEEDTTSLNVNNNNNINNTNNNNIGEPDVSPEGLNQLNTGSFLKTYYTKPKLDIEDQELYNLNLESVTKLVNELNIPLDNRARQEKEVDTSEMLGVGVEVKESNKMADAFLSGVKDEIRKCDDSNRVTEGMEISEMEDPVVPRKKEKIEMTQSLRKTRATPANFGAQLPPANMPSRTTNPRRSRDKKRSPDALGSFDVYNIETAMPVIDLDAIENHLRLAKEEERRRRNDREEIRRRLATGCDGDEYFGGDRPGRKPSLQARLQSGMNLQICFMNETMSDTESPNSESEAVPAKAVTPVKQPSPLAALPNTRSVLQTNGNHKSISPDVDKVVQPLEADFLVCQSRLQTEARLALAQAKDLARLHMEMERQRQTVSPITEMLRATLLKVGVVFPEDRRRVSRQMLTDMNVAQLQVIVNDLHTQIEYLNESLVKFLMERDDLHMSQDSMLVDIEDLTRYLGAKENTFKEDISFNNNLPATKPKINRIAN